MSTWHVVGLAGDHASSPQVLVMNYFTSNWALTTPLTAVQMRFSTGWYDEQADFQIHFRRNNDPVERRKTLGSAYIHAVDDFVNLHFFARQLTSSTETGNSEPPELDQMYREAQRIIGQGTTGLQVSQGIRSMSFLRLPRTLPRESDRESVFHGYGLIGLQYMKVYS